MPSCGFYTPFGVTFRGTRSPTGSGAPVSFYTPFGVTFRGTPVMITSENYLEFLYALRRDVPWNTVPITNQTKQVTTFLYALRRDVPWNNAASGGSC